MPPGNSPPGDCSAMCKPVWFLRFPVLRSGRRSSAELYERAAAALHSVIMPAGGFCQAARLSWFPRESAVFRGQFESGRKSAGARTGKPACLTGDSVIECDQISRRLPAAGSAERMSRVETE